MITSLSNDKIKLVRGLARRKTRWNERSFVLEGTRLLNEVVQQDIQPKFVLYTEDTSTHQDAAPMIELLTQSGVPCYVVSDAVMKACTDTVTPPGLLAVVPFPAVPIPVDSTWTLLVDSVRTPGNLGAILRTAAAAGVELVLLAPGTVDMYNPKVVRGGAGAHFRLPILAVSWSEIKTRLQDLQVWLASAEGEISYTTVDWQGPLALIVGGEAHGASQAAAALVDRQVKIPMARAMESLNVAVATGVLLFEINRQRRVTERAKH
jgi:TrmH family RNA methyltransferase